MPSAAGKRVGRVLAGCSKPEAIDKPGLPPGKILGSSRYPCIGHQDAATSTCRNSDTKNMNVGFVCTSEQESRLYAMSEFSNSPVSPFLPFHPEITISRSLEGKYTFLGETCWVLGKGG